MGVLVVSALTLLAGCTGSTPPAWKDVTPPGMAPAALFAGADTVFVGGQSTGAAAAPVLLTRADDGWRAIPATPATGYGQVATIVEGAADPAGRIVLMGTATGGAHLNPRWTTWIGDGAGLVEEPQTVDTFGGSDAGGITGVTYGDEPGIVGSRSLAPGVIGIAVWRHQGAIWVQQPSPPVFVGTPPATMESATAAAAVGATTVIVGLETRLAGGAVRQRAELWRSDGAGWTRLDLDPSAGDASTAGTSAADGSAADGSDGAGVTSAGIGAEVDGADVDSAATGVTCTDTDCLVVGRRDGALVAWRVVGDRIEPVPLPARTVDHYTGNPLVARDGALTAIAVGAGPDLLTSRDGRTWTSLAAPPGEARGLVVRGDRVLLLVREETGGQQVYEHGA